MSHSTVQRRPGVGVPTLRQELEATGTALWFQAARSTQRAGAWDERMRCFAALSELLDERRAPRRPGERLSQPPIQLPGVLKEVAHRVPFSGAEPVYRRWRASQDSRQTGRWAGPDSAVRPADAFVAEAKVVTFWPYREGVLKIADAFDMSSTEVAASYLRALAAWASDDIPLAACHPGGVPGCVLEDMVVLAARTSSQAGAVPPQPVPRPVRAARLAELAGDVVAAVLADASITPLGAFNTVRNEVLLLLAESADSIASRVTSSVAELADRILHGTDGEPALTLEEADQILTALRGLTALLADTADTPETPEGDR